MIKPIQILIAQNGNNLPTEIVQGLENREYRTTFVENQKQVLDICSESPPGLALIDLSGEKFSGLDIISAIKDKSPDTQIIVCVDGQDVDQVTEAFKFGASNYITKPLNSELVFAVIQKSVGRYQTIRAYQELEINHRSSIAFRDGLAKGELSARKIIDGSPMGIHIYRLESEKRLVFVGSNPAADHILGLENTQFIGKTIEEAFPPLAETEIPQHYRKVAAHGGTWHNHQISYRDKVIDDAFEVHVFQTQPGNIAVFFTDVMDRINAEAALVNSESRYRTLSSATFEGIGITEKGTLIDVNDQLADMLGYKREEIIGTRVEDHVYPEDRTFVDQKGDERVEEPYEHRALRKDGSVIFVEVRPRTLVVDDRLIRITAVRDISERKHTDETIKASEEKFNQVFHASPNPIALTSFPDEIFVDVNQSFLTATGYKLDEIIGYKDTDINLWVDEDYREQLNSQLVDSGYVRNFETDYRRKDGGISTAIMSADILHLDGKIHLLSAFQDISDRKVAEAEIERRAQQLTSINVMGQIATSSLDLDQVLNNVVNVVPGLVGAEGVSLLFLEDDEFVFAAASGDVSESLRDLRMPSNTGVAGRVLKTGNPILVRDKDDRKQIYSEIDDQSGYQTESLLAVPLILSGDVVGVMEAVHSEQKAFTTDDLHLLETAAAWTAIALGNARQHQALQRQLQESQAVAAISQALNETLDLDRILNLIADSARKVIPQVERAVIHMLDEDQDLLSAIAVSSVFKMNKTYLSMRAGIGVAGQVMVQGQTINIGDTTDDPRFVPGKRIGSTHLRSLMVAPIQSGDRRIGTISVSSEAPRVFSSTDENLLTILGVQAALAIEAARLFEETHKRAHYLGMLNNMTSTALQIPDLKTTLKSLAGQLVLLFESDGCYLNLWDEVNQRVLLHTSSGPDLEPIDFILPEPGEQTMTESVLKAGAVLIAEDVFNTPYLSPKISALFPVCSLMGLPLIADDQKIGAALVGFNTPHVFTPEEIILGEQIARQVTLVIAKAKLLESEQRRRQEAETLREVAATITSTLEIDRVLEHILTNLEQVIPYDSAGVILDMVDHLSVVACKGTSDQESLFGEQLPVDSPLYSEIWDRKTTIIIDDAQVDPRWIGHMELTNIRGWIGIPLLVQDQVIGYLTINNLQAGAYGEPEADLAQVFANQAAVAIQNARLYDSTRQRLKEVNTLYSINNQIVASIDVHVDEITQQIVNTLWSEFGYYHVHIYLFDEGRKTLTVQQGSGPIGAQMAVEGHRLTLDEGVVGYVATVGDAFIANITEAVHFYIPNPLLPDTSAELAAPLRASGKLLGVLDIHHRSPNKFTEDDLRLVQTVADQLAAGLEKAMLYTELQEALTMEKSIRAQLVQTEKLAAMGRLVASVAHELNNPLQAIQNALYLVKLEEDLTQQAGEDLRVALDETTRMGNLIARLRDAYRPASLEKHKPELLNTLVDEVEKLIGTHLRHNKVVFEFQPDPDLPRAMMNRDQIKQVLLNLCLNAVETMPDGGKLLVETHYHAPDPSVIFKVKDTGPGISPEVISHIFEPFYTTKEKGTGLGLFISYEILQNHGGNIIVESVKGEGAVFTFSLPVEVESSLN